MSIQMDTKIFDYLKQKRAVFEVRHYILPTTRRMIQEGYGSVSTDGD